MIFYKNGSVSLLKMKQIQVPKERIVQTLLENNLSVILKLEWIKSELRIENKRIDTLAFDRVKKAFVIIEYKRSKNKSVVDQGWTYYGLLLRHKADIMLMYSEFTGNPIRKGDINWSATRIVFIAPDFTENQRLATLVKNLNIELWQIRFYENDLIGIYQVIGNGERLF